MSDWQIALLMLAGAIFFFTMGFVVGKVHESIMFYRWLSGDSRRSLREAIDILRTPSESKHSPN